MLYTLWSQRFIAEGWKWTSPNGRITHTYFPRTLDAYVLYRSRGWQMTRSNKP